MSYRRSPVRRRRFGLGAGDAPTDASVDASSAPVVMVDDGSGQNMPAVMPDDSTVSVVKAVPDAAAVTIAPDGTVKPIDSSGGDASAIAPVVSPLSTPYVPDTSLAPVMAPAPVVVPVPVVTSAPSLLMSPGPLGLPWLWWGVGAGAAWLMFSGRSSSVAANRRYRRVRRNSRRGVRRHR